MSIPSHESEQSCIYVRGINLACFFDLDIEFGSVPSLLNFCFSIYYRGFRGCDWYGSWIYNYLCNQCLITTDVGSTPGQGDVYNIM